MCGRYKLSTPGDELWEHFDLHGEQLPLVPRYNIAPTQPIAVIRVPHTLELVRWGLPMTNPKAGGFNVRVESLAAPMYREAIRQRRCRTGSISAEPQPSSETHSPQSLAASM